MTNPFTEVHCLEIVVPFEKDPILIRTRAIKGPLGLVAMWAFEFLFSTIIETIDRVNDVN